MATKRFTKSAIDWAKIAERVPENQKLQFGAFKTKSDSYLRRVLANPATAPKIDFSGYKSKLGGSLAPLVDSFQKQYEALKVPYPAENVTPLIAEQEKSTVEEVKKFVSESTARIAALEMAIKDWEKVLPYEEMTLDDAFDAFPNKCMDPIGRPSYYPHGTTDEFGYVEPEGTKAAAH